MKAKILLVLALAVCLAGCSTTQCTTAKNVFDTAQKVYAKAKADGAPVQKIEEYKWAVDAAQSVVVIWCDVSASAISE